GTRVAAIKPPLSILRAILRAHWKPGGEESNQSRFHRFASIRISFRKLSSWSSSLAPAGKSFAVPAVCRHRSRTEPEKPEPPRRLKKPVNRSQSLVLFPPAQVQLSR